MTPIVANRRKNRVRLTSSCSNEIRVAHGQFHGSLHSHIWRTMQMWPAEDRVCKYYVWISRSTRQPRAFSFEPLMASVSLECVCLMNRTAMQTIELWTFLFCDPNDYINRSHSGCVCVATISNQWDHCRNYLLNQLTDWVILLNIQDHAKEFPLQRTQSQNGRKNCVVNWIRGLCLNVECVCLQKILASLGFWLSHSTSSK